MTATQQAMPNLHEPYSIYLAQSLPASVQQVAITLLQQLPAKYIANIQHANVPLDQIGAADTMMIGESVMIKNMVDGRGLACPMPLLKTKVALRDVAIGESLYVVATDANSQADITAFCRQNQQKNTANPLLLVVNKVTKQQPVESSSPQRFDTIYHFIITKTDSN